MKKFFSRFLIISNIGVLVSAYLLFHHTEVKNGYQVGESFCSINQVFDCDAIVLSRFSEVLGIPLGSFGLLYYFLLTSFLIIQKKAISKDKISEKMAAIVFFYCWVSLPATLLLFTLSNFYLKKICIFCSILYLINIILCILSYCLADRPRGFSTAFFTGLKEFFSFTFSFNPQSLKFLTAFILGGYLIYLTPQKILIPYYFEPRLASMFDRKTFEPFLEIWRNSPIEDLKINTETNPLKKDFSIGNPNATITIVEYADFECPFCKIIGKHLQSQVKDNPDKYRLIYKNFPLDMSCNRMINGEKHLFACKAAVMARCAGIQGDEYFWKMNEDLISMKEFDEESLNILPKKIGLNMDNFQSCISKPEAKDKILSDIEEAINLKIQGTPSIFYNGKRIVDKKLLPYLLPGLLKFMYEETKKTNS